MRGRSVSLGLLLAAATFAGCGGGTSTPSSPIVTGSPTATPASSPPTPTPTATPTATANPNATFTPLPVPSGSPLALASFVLSGGEQDVIAPVTSGRQFIPDEQMTFLRQPDGSFDLWTSAGGPFGTYLFKTPDLFSLGSPTTVLSAAGAGTTAFDADYAGAGNVFPAANGIDLLMIYHGENHLFGGVDYPSVPFYATVGLARSHDGGVTWQRQGAILSGEDPQQSTQAATGAGALTPTAIEVGGFIYVIFRETDLQSGVSGYAIARAPIAGDGAPGTWSKLYQGAFATPGLGGAFTPLGIVLDPAVPSDQRQPNVSFNTYLNSYIMCMVGNGGLYVLTSPDLVTWSAGTVVLPAPEPDAMAGSTKGLRNWFPTLVSPSEPSQQLTAQTGYLYYAKFAVSGSANHTMYRQAFTITAGANSQARVRATSIKR